MDERQADMVRVDDDLADPRADDPAAPGVEIAQASPADDLDRIRGSEGDEIAQFEYDLLQLRRGLLEE
jgi:hypothetical protein